jgi:uncharacterized protein
MLKVADIEVSQEQLAFLCQQYGVKELALFGSRARGDNRPDSDLDLLIEFFPDKSLGFIAFAGLQQEFESLFGKKVDLVPKGGLKPLIKLTVLPDLIPIYDATA